MARQRDVCSICSDLDNVVNGIMVGIDKLTFCTNLASLLPVPYVVEPTDRSLRSLHSARKRYDLHRALRKDLALSIGAKEHCKKFARADSSSRTSGGSFQSDRATSVHRFNSFSNELNGVNLVHRGLQAQDALMKVYRPSYLGSKQSDTGYLSMFAPQCARALRGFLSWSLEISIVGNTLML